MAAAVRLSACTDVSVWERIEQQSESVKGEALKEVEETCNFLLGDEITKEELMQLVRWKFAVGKPRPQLLGLLKSNTESSVTKASKVAIMLAKEMKPEKCVNENTGELSEAGKEAVKHALEELTKLKGVGPATATAVLTQCRPDLICYMFDEVIDTFEPKRDYTMSIYLRINSECLKIAKTLGGNWTTARVAKVLWTAARVLAQNGDDLTALLTESSKRSDDNTLQKKRSRSIRTGRKKRKINK